jgi:hypothetical protein
MKAAPAFSDEKILRVISPNFGGSSPGDELHHLVLGVSTPTALGVPDLGVHVFAIAPADLTEPAEMFVARTIVAAAVETAPKGQIYLAALTIETHAVHMPEDRDEVTENRARRMRSDERLQDHELAVEQTMLYAAVRDGRRWHGSHYLTGPEAGVVDGPHATGPGERVDADYGMPCSQLIRRTVGLAW